nr:MAG TPA: hypothetical protein [Microviridae sp.]
MIIFLVKCQYFFFNFFSIFSKRSCGAPWRRTVEHDVTFCFADRTASNWFSTLSTLSTCFQHKVAQLLLCNLLYFQHFNNFSTILLTLKFI